jgi:hypothetical protein
MPPSGFYITEFFPAKFNFWQIFTTYKITDASGNAINYVYSEDNANGEYALSRINYSNNSLFSTPSKEFVSKD